MEAPTTLREVKGIHSILLSNRQAGGYSEQYRFLSDKEQLNWNSQMEKHKSLIFPWSANEAERRL